jgi:hypothetical protein
MWYLIAVAVTAVWILAMLWCLKAFPEVPGGHDDAWVILFPLLVGGFFVVLAWLHALGVTP